MGSSLGLGMGLYHGTNGKTMVISIIGDSTFFHTGLPALVNAVYNKTPMLVLILDNRVTAMTGGQPNPTSTINIEDIAKAIGADYVRTVDPFNVRNAQEVMMEAVNVVRKGGIAVVVMKRGCALEAMRLFRGLRGALLRRPRRMQGLRNMLQPNCMPGNSAPPRE